MFQRAQDILFLGTFSLFSHIKVFFSHSFYSILQKKNPLSSCKKLKKIL